MLVSYRLFFDELRVITEPKLPDLAHDEDGRCVGSNNLWWGNYIFTSDPGRFGGEGRAAGDERGLVLSRYGGLGTHRYPVGFSGDAQQSYLTLQFQIEMTPKASNVLFGWWSHDIGGFHNGRYTTDSVEHI